MCVCLYSVCASVLYASVLLLLVFCLTFLMWYMRLGELRRLSRCPLSARHHEPFDILARLQPPEQPAQRQPCIATCLRGLGTPENTGRRQRWTRVAEERDAKVRAEPPSNGRHETHRAGGGLVGAISLGKEPAEARGAEGPEES